MAGWMSPDRENIFWDGTIRAKNFFDKNGQVAGITNGTNGSIVYLSNGNGFGTTASNLSWDEGAGVLNLNKIQSDSGVLDVAETTLNVNPLSGVQIAGTFSDAFDGTIVGTNTAWLTDLQQGDLFYDDQFAITGVIMKVVSNSICQVQADYSSDSPNVAHLIRLRGAVSFNGVSAADNRIPVNQRGDFYSIGTRTGGAPNQVLNFDLAGEYGFVRFRKTAPNDITYYVAPANGKTVRVFSFTNFDNNMEYFSWDIDTAGNPALNMHGGALYFGSSPGGTWIERASLTNAGVFKAAGYASSDGSAGITATITTAKLTPATGSNGSMTFKNGILTAQTQAT